MEVIEARKTLNDHFSRGGAPLLFVLVDGVGFRSNSAGLNGVLESADEFCQFRTLWKVVVVASCVVGIPVTLRLPEEAIREHREFLGRFKFLSKVTPESGRVPARHRVDAGDGTVLLG